MLLTPEWHPWPEAPVEGSWGREQVLAVRRSHEVVVLTTRPGQTRWRPRVAIGDEVEDGVRTVRVRYSAHPVSKLSFLIRLRAMSRAAAHLAERGFRPDLIHAKVFSAGFPSLLLGRRLGVPVIVSEHYTGFPRGTLSAWDRLIARLTFRGAALVCPDSADLGGYISRLEPRARVRPMPNVVDTEAFHPPERAREGAGARLLNVASLHDKKGHEAALAALALVRRERPDVTLQIVGDGPRRAELGALAQELGVQDAVEFLGARPKREIAELMRTADLFVLPSLWENAPHVVIEALASGLPVVATDVGGVSELVAGTGARLVPPADPGALADALRALWDDGPEVSPERVAELTRNRFGHEAVERRWAEIYSEVISVHRGRSAPA